MFSQPIQIGVVAIYVAATLFGQHLHAWSGCEHAVVAPHAHSHGYEASGHHHPEQSHPEQSHPEPGHVALSEDGVSDGHSHQVGTDSCAICQHLSMSQAAGGSGETRQFVVALQNIEISESQISLAIVLGPNSPRAPPV